MASRWQHLPKMVHSLVCNPADQQQPLSVRQSVNFSARVAMHFVVAINQIDILTIDTMIKIW